MVNLTEEQQRNKRIVVYCEEEQKETVGHYIGRSAVCDSCVKKYEVTDGKDYCPKCEKLTKFKFYGGALGYESLICSVCGFDANDTTLKDLTTLYNKMVK